MASDNLIYATNSTRTVVSSLKKKLSNLRISVENLGSELEKMETKLENVVTQSDIYKSRIEREMGREVRRLERELALLRKNGAKPEVSEVASDQDLKVARTIGFFDTLLRHMCQNADDFRLASESFLFPAVYERVMAGDEEAYFLDEVPASAAFLLERGKGYIEWLRAEFDTHLTDPETWNQAIEFVVDWWRNDALPLLYGSRDEQWDIDIALTLTEMLLWREEVANRPLNFPRIFDAYEVFRKHKDEVYESSGLRKFDVQMFTYSE